jgi:hypothetical protein
VPNASRLRDIPAPSIARRANPRKAYIKPSSEDAAS